jgi:hypothetical protein
MMPSLSQLLGWTCRLRAVADIRQAASILFEAVALGDRPPILFGLNYCLREGTY